MKRDQAFPWYVQSGVTFKYTEAKNTSLFLLSTVTSFFEGAQVFLSFLRKDMSSVTFLYNQMSNHINRLITIQLSQRNLDGCQ